MRQAYYKNDYPQLSPYGCRQKLLDYNDFSKAAITYSTLIINDIFIPPKTAWIP